MPTPMIHLGAGMALDGPFAAYRGDPAFYLGLLAPDAVHMRDGWSRPDKRRSHFIDLRFDGLPAEELAGRLRPLVRENRARGEAYLAGYVAHLFTDWLWLDRYLPRLPALYDEAGHVRSGEYYNDLDQADIALYQRLPGRPAVWAALARARAVDLPGLVSAGEADRWRLHVLTWFDAALSDMGRYRPVRVLTYDFARAFVAGAAAELPALLRLCGDWPVAGAV